MWKDPIVEEVRKIRQEIEAECENDFEKIFRLAMARQQRYGGKLVPSPVRIPKDDNPLPHVERA
ncbi:MAG: hypothetical protein HYR55_16555 [Acidobacteria bacterium]|nr:hypothetical protein [Acidobacteriota bacterium]MBI3657397.1 hypothetical protein [Acidobacteriota bacterium]